MKEQPSPSAPQQPQPAAYDTEGRPLYHHPPQPAASQVSQPTSLVTSRSEQHVGHNFDPKLRAQYANEPSIVHAARQHEPTVPEMSEALKRKHEESKRRYPYLNLSEGEFVMLRIHRHPIGLFIPVGITSFLLLLLAVVMFLVPDFYNSASAAQSVATLPPAGTVVGGILLLMLLVGLIGGIAIWVYLRNQFFLTNESVIQEIQHGLFSRHEQTVSLGSIEDASFKQYGLLPHIFNYGLMRLSTEGEETTYRFNFVENPKQQIAIVNNAVEAFKNGRPVGSLYLEDER